MGADEIVFIAHSLLIHCCIAPSGRKGGKEGAAISTQRRDDSRSKQAAHAARELLPPPQGSRPGAGGGRLFRWVLDGGRDLSPLRRVFG